MSQFVLNNKSKQATGLCVALSFHRKGREVTKIFPAPRVVAGDDIGVDCNVHAGLVIPRKPMQLL